MDVLYPPGAVTGLSFGIDNGNVGAEIGIIARFRADFPNDTLYLIKVCTSGSFQSRRPATGKLTGSIAEQHSDPDQRNRGNEFGAFGYWREHPNLHALSADRLGLLSRDDRADDLHGRYGVIDDDDPVQMHAVMVIDGRLHL